MKKLMAGVTLAAMLTGLIPAPAMAESLTWTVGKNEFTVDADSYVADTEVFVNSRGILMVPVRAIVEKMNGTVEYFAADNRVHLELKNWWADITIGEELTDENIDDAEIGMFGDERHDIGTVRDGRLYLPAYLLAFAINADMHIIYDENNAPYRVFFYVK